MKVREKILQELNRRLGEVAWFEEKQLTSQTLAQTFFARLADYVNYVKTNKELQNFCKDLEQQRKNLNIDKELLEEGEKILSKLQKDFKRIRNFLKKSRIKVLSLSEAFPPGFVGSVSVQGGIALDYHQIESFVKGKNKFVGDLPKQIRTLAFLISRLKKTGIKMDNLEKIPKSYDNIIPGYEAKLRLQKTYIAFLRFYDYEKLLDVWRLYYETDDSRRFFLLRLETGDILNESTYIPSLNQGDIIKLEKLRSEHLLHLHRFNNYLVDRLEEKILVEETLYWLWGNFGKQIVVLWFAIFILFVLKKYFGISLVPSEIFNVLLR